MNHGPNFSAHLVPAQSDSGSQDAPPMVSHAEVVDQPHRPSSIASRSRKSSHRHRNRSHHGSVHHLHQNEFPFFAQSGDVEIVIACDGQEKRYLLHRLILAQFSGHFDSDTREEWPRQRATKIVQPLPPRNNELSIIGEDVSSPASATPLMPEQVISGPQPTRGWRYELDWENAHDDEEPILVQKPLSRHDSLISPAVHPPPISQRPTHPPTTRTSFFRSMANLSINQSPAGPPSQSTTNIAMLPADPITFNPIIRDYDNLFRIFYNHSPTLNSVNIASAYSECKSLLTLADMYSALAVVGPRIDHHLLRFSSRLFKQIAKYPPSYLKLGYLARSRIIFSEALTHVVGQWPMGSASLNPSNPQYGSSGYEVPLSVLDLIEDKYDELEELKMKIEAKLFRLTLTTSRGERVNPSNDYIGWLAMSLWRQWLAENTTPEIRGILKSNTPSVQGTHARGISAARGQISSASSTVPPPQQPPATTAIPSSARLYRLIASSDPQTYLPHDELKRFLKLHPLPSSSAVGALYTRDTLKRFERKMDEIKNVARDLVKPLTRNCLELDLRMLGDGGGGPAGGAGGLGYLTCTRVEDGELPWD